MGFEAVDITTKSGFQEIQIPDNLRIDDTKVYLKRVGNVLYVIPFSNPWQSLIDSIDRFSTDFMDDRNQEVNQVREFLD